MTRAKGAPQFTVARKLGEGTWKINGCPHDGGTLVSLGSGRFGAVWQRSGDVFFTGGDGKEMKLGSGRQPVAAGHDGKTMVVWNDGSSLVGVRDLRRIEPIKIAADARFPLLLSQPGGKGTVLAYEHGTKESTSIAIDRL